MGRIDGVTSTHKSDPSAGNRDGFQFSQPRLSWRSGRIAKRAVIRLSLVLVFAVAQGFSLGCSRSRPEAETASRPHVEDDASVIPLAAGQTLAIPCEARLSIGHLRRGGCRKCQFWLQNPGKDPISLGKTSVSCDCVSLDVDGRTIPGGERRSASLRIDLSDQPTFTGGLSLECKLAESATFSSVLTVLVEVMVD